MGRRKGVNVSPTTRLKLAELLPPRCYYCDKQFSSKRKPTLEHIIPVCRGGSNHSSNLALTCYPCNFKKADMTGEEFLEFLGRGGEITRRGHMKGEPEMDCGYRLDCVYCGEPFFARNPEVRCCGPEHRNKYQEYRRAAEAPLFAQLAKSYGLFGYGVRE